MARVLPPGQYPLKDIGPEHPIYRTMFPMADLPQIPSIQFWRGSGGASSERGSDSAVAHLRGIFNAKGELMVLATHNTDISDAWEREGEDPRVLLHLLAQRLRDGDEHHAVRDEPLAALRRGSGSSLGSGLGARGQAEPCATLNRVSASSLQDILVVAATDRELAPARAGRRWSAASGPSMPRRPPRRPSPCSGPARSCTSASPARGAPRACRRRRSSSASSRATATWRARDVGTAPAVAGRGAGRRRLPGAAARRRAGDRHQRHASAARPAATSRRWRVRRAQGRAAGRRAGDRSARHLERDRGSRPLRCGGSTTPSPRCRRVTPRAGAGAGACVS